MLDRARAMARSMARAMALAVARHAVADSGLDIAGASAQNGVCWGTGVVAVAASEDAYHSVFRDHNWRPRPTTVITMMDHAPAALISLEFGIAGPTLANSVACASSATSLGEAMRAIQHGEIDCAVLVARAASQRL